MGEVKDIKKDKRKKKVAICGFAPHYEKAPFDDDSFEIWGCNTLFRRLPRIDRNFDIHPFNTFTDKKVKGADNYIEELANLDCPVYMIEEREEIPNSVRYPIEKMIKKYFNFSAGEKYFTNSISYMIALAIEEGYDVIHVYGVDMAQDSEYSDQRPSCEYFLGVARGMGIEVYLPPASSLLKTKFLYGYDDNKVDAFIEKEKERLKFMKKKQNEAKQKAEQAKTVAAQYAGAINSAKHVMKQWGPLRYREKNQIDKL